MSEVTHKEVVELFSSQQEAIKEIVHANQTAVNATTKAETNRIDTKLDQVIKHQEEQNSMLAKHDKKLIKIKPVLTVMKNKKWLFIGLFAFCYSVTWIYLNVDIVQIIRTLIFKL